MCVCVQVAAGGSHSCGVDEDRHLRCWGNHYDMQTVVPYPNSYLRVDAGWLHTCAIQSDQSLVCWGANDSGQCDGECVTVRGGWVGGWVGVDTKGCDFLSICIYHMQSLSSTADAKGGHALDKHALVTLPAALTNMEFKGNVPARRKETGLRFFFLLLLLVYEA